MKKILILAANPKGTAPLRLDQESREIEAGLERAKRRDQFELIKRQAVRPIDLRRVILDECPQIVHFSGHGEGENGLVFEDDSGSIKLVDGESLAGLFKLFANEMECVVLNGCFSEIQANAIVQHINYVIGMTQAIGDKAAIAFATAFYDALGAGKTYEFAYNYACNAIQLEQPTPAQRKLTPVDTESKPFDRKGIHCISESAFTLGVPNILAFEQAIQYSRCTLLIISIEMNFFEMGKSFPDPNKGRSQDWLKQCDRYMVMGLKRGLHQLMDWMDTFEIIPLPDLKVSLLS